MLKKGEFFEKTKLEYQPDEMKIEEAQTMEIDEGDGLQECKNQQRFRYQEQGYGMLLTGSSVRPEMTPNQPVEVPKDAKISTFKNYCSENNIQI